jgi:putative membrane protein
MITMSHPNATGIVNSEELGIERTYLAQDRTMLAWVRTATSLITFGFSIHTFMGQRGVATHRWLGPTDVSIVMISIGLFSLLLATIQHRSDRRRLRAVVPTVPYSPAAALACLIALLGFLALVSVMFRN